MAIVQDSSAFGLMADGLRRSGVVNYRRVILLAEKEDGSWIESGGAGCWSCFTGCDPMPNKRSTPR